ncbi:MAG: TIGR02444 family protein [Pseudomonadota bacterium]
MNMPPESFWHYAHRVYSKSGVSQCCLSLQDLYGLDVNLLLFACWHARTRGLFERALLEDALVLSAQWADHVVKPLRGARRWMKKQTESDAVLDESVLTADFYRLREQIKGLELQCEQFQENSLEALTKAPLLSLSEEMQIASAAYNLHYILLSTINSQHFPRPLQLRDFLATLVLSALDQDPDDLLLHQAISQELSAQKLDT